MAKAQTQKKTEILESGDIFFLFRPRVDDDDPSGSDDVQRFYLVLRPESGGKVRLIVLGRKHLPEADEHERVWGFVDAVEDSAGKLEPALREATYETKTRGEQRRPAVRPAGEGVYIISLEDGQMHLSYELELPKKTGDVQEAFNIVPKASYALSVKNPEKGQPKGVGLRKNQKADYPKKLQQEFRERRFDQEDVKLLDYEGAELILVGARTDPEKTYGLEIKTENEDYDHAEVVNQLHMARSRHPVAPLFTGRWD